LPFLPEPVLKSLLEKSKHWTVWLQRLDDPVRKSARSSTVVESPGCVFLVFYQHQIIQFQCIVVAEGLPIGDPHVLALWWWPPFAPTGGILK
jgi:hypothetical protein